MDIQISADELKTAPRAVREWLGATLARQLSLANDASEPQHDRSLAALGPDAAAALLARLGDDHVATAVFFELGRDATAGPAGPVGLHRLAFADVLHHARLSRPEELIAALNRIETVFEDIYPAVEAPLVALTQDGQLYVTDDTRRSINALWQGIAASRLSNLARADRQGPSVPVAAGMPASATPGALDADLGPALGY